MQGETKLDGDIVWGKNKVAKVASVEPAIDFHEGHIFHEGWSKETKNRVGRIYPHPAWGLH